MNVTAPISSDSSAPPVRGRRVIDAPTRATHWLLALAFVVAYVTGDTERLRPLHVSAGYVMVVLLVFRVVYGLVGPRSVRWPVLWRKAAGAPAWLRGAWRARTLGAISWTSGTHIATGIAVLAVLGTAVPLLGSGWLVWQDVGGDVLAELHEMFGQLMLTAVGVHVAIIGVASVVRRRNLVRPMLSGRADAPGPDVVKANRGGLAALVVVAAFGVAAWSLSDVPAADTSGRPARVSADRGGDDAD